MSAPEAPHKPEIEAPEVRHSVRIHKEKVWPFQWIGVCRCGKGTRCNSEAYAREFLADCLRPALRAPLTGSPSGEADHG